MTRFELEEILLRECGYRIRRLGSDELDSELAAIQNGLELRLSAMPSRERWECGSCRMEAADCDCALFGSNQVV
jgi:hypothetical protein